MAGNTAEAEFYKTKGDELKNAIFEKLWDDKLSFFVEITHDEKYRVVGKESNCYSAWSFHLAPDEDCYGKAWEYAVREDVFLSKYGLTTLEKQSPHYMQSFNCACRWNGPVWPYTFSLILTGLANLLSDYKNHTMTNEAYYDLLCRYALCHYDSNSTEDFAVRENHHPEENCWIASAKNYNHSTFIDNVLNGLLGIRPSEESMIINPLIPEGWEYFCVEDVKWRGKNLSVVYDKNGEKFGCGKGLHVFINDELIAKADTLQEIVIKLDLLD